MSLHGVGPIYGMTKIWNETTWATFTKNPKYEMGKIQFTKWKKSNLRNETFYITTENIQNTKWKNPNYEMTKTTKGNVQFTKWTKFTCCFQKISNLRNDLHRYCEFQKMSNLRNGLNSHCDLHKLCNPMGWTFFDFNYFRNW